MTLFLFGIWMFKVLFVLKQLSLNPLREGTGERRGGRYRS